MLHYVIKRSDVVRIVTVAKDALQIPGVTSIAQSQKLKPLACIQHPRCIQDRQNTLNEYKSYLFTTDSS